MFRSRSICTVFSLFLLTSAFSWCQATRTWVSGVGDDANPCSRTAPCKTFAGAISKTAVGGEIDVLDPGGFGALTITKSISIEADGVIAGVLVSGTNGIVVAAGPNDVVVIRGLTFEGLGTGLNGISFQSGASLHVEKCTINGFSQRGIDITPNTSADVVIKDTVIRNNPGGGVYFHPAGVGVSGSLEDVRLDRNLFGLRADDGANVTFRRSTSSGNTNDGITAVSTNRAVSITVDNSLVVNNGSSNTTAGITVNGSSAGVAVGNSTLMNNYLNALSTVNGGGIVSFGNNQILGGGSITVTIAPR
jgi:hypothetical protein